MTASRGNSRGRGGAAHARGALGGVPPDSLSFQAAEQPDRDEQRPAPSSASPPSSPAPCPEPIEGGRGSGGGAALLREAHVLLLAHYDIDRWHWTDDTPAYDICLGSILVQHTAWTNVEKALTNLREAGIDSIEALHALDEEAVAALIRPSGTPVVKARRLRAFTTLVTQHGGFEALFHRPAEDLRRLLLATHGIGPETADVICLYGARHPVVVHDAYTARLCSRLGTGPEGTAYETWRAWLDVTLPASWNYRARNHAAIVVHCKEICRVKPKCAACPLREMCAYRAEAEGRVVR